MAATLQAQWSASLDTSFTQRVEMAMCLAAINISSEATATTNHTNRANYAKAVLNAPATYAPLFAAACASEGVDSSSTDAQISSMISSVWSALAGTI